MYEIKLVVEFWAICTFLDTSFEPLRVEQSMIAFWKQRNRAITYFKIIILYIPLNGSKVMSTKVRQYTYHCFVISLNLLYGPQDTYFNRNMVCMRTRWEMRTKIHQNNQIFRSLKKSILSNFDFLGLVFGEKLYKGMKNDIIKLKFKFLLFWAKFEQKMSILEIVI